MKLPTSGKLVVPIVPDEARTFGMESLFREFGIYASQGQLYKPVDADMLLYYKEAQNGQILEEGITEAGSMASCIAAGTAYANYGVPMIPFFIYYSMFGFQRVGDLIWAFADSRGKGFLMGGTAGRTTLSGEGLQHQDGHSLVLASTVPTCAIYDPAYAYEIAVIVQDGIRRMYQEGEDRFYYITVYNENYVQPPMPGPIEGIREGDSARHLQVPPGRKGRTRSSPGAVIRQRPDFERSAARAADSGGALQVPADVWSVTSYNELRREGAGGGPLEPPASGRDAAHAVHRATCWRARRGRSSPPRDYMKAVPDQLAPWLGARLDTLGTDGFGRSDNREHLRRFFEISAEAIVQATLSALAREEKVDPHLARTAIAELGLDADSPDPVTQ